MRMTLLIACGAGLFAAGAAGAAGASKRALDASDFERLLSVEGVACSADGSWIAYTVEGSDLESDERKSSVWMTDFEGGTDLRLTAAGESASDPTFSPDGRYVSFLSERKDDTKSLHLLDRRGGEAQPLEAIAGDVGEYAWSPDGARLVISMSEDAKGEAGKSARPIVIDRLHFKQDRDGYLTAADRTQLYLFDIVDEDPDPAHHGPGGRRHRAGVFAGRPSHRLFQQSHDRCGPYREARARLDRGAGGRGCAQAHGVLRAQQTGAAVDTRRHAPALHARVSSRGSTPTFRTV